MASVYSDDVVFSQHFVDVPSASYPDNHSRIEIYATPGDQRFIEMELLGPLRERGYGPTSHFNIVWRLNRLEAKPKDDKQMVESVTKLMTIADGM
jgi:hypothetical protein